MKVAELLRSLADMISSVEGGDQPQQAEPMMTAVSVDNTDHATGNDVFVPPLQAKLEILKKSVGMDNVYDGQGDDLDQIKKMAGLPTAVQHEAADDEPFDG
jgi:hypothetical protein